MTQREAGWYWVRHRQFSGWHIAEKTPGGGWLMTGIALPYDDDDMKEIGARIPAPGEPWQCVPVDCLEDVLDVLRSDAGPIAMVQAADRLEDSMMLVPESKPGVK